MPDTVNEPTFNVSLKVLTDLVEGAATFTAPPADFSATPPPAGTDEADRARVDQMLAATAAGRAVLAQRAAAAGTPVGAKPPMAELSPMGRKYLAAMHKHFGIKP